MKKSILLTLLFFVSASFLTAQPAFPGTEPFKIQVPEVQELVFIIYSISQQGRNDTFILNRESAYYQKVIQYFHSHSSNKLVNKTGNYFRNNYDNVRMDACNYYFDMQGFIQRKEGVNNLSWGRKDFIKPFVKELQAIAGFTGFRDFYEQNASFYDSITGSLASQIQAENLKYWLEARFSIIYDNYLFFISPLNWGRHTTNNYTIKNKKCLAVFISSPYNNTRMGKEMLAAINSRIVFTEIDHNFINPTSDLYKKKIKKAFHNREKWTNGGFSDFYNNEYAVFNEYMTWSLFTLYAFDNYSPDIFSKVKNEVEKQMVTHRGFYRFKEFNEHLLALYNKENGKIKIVDLYDPVLNWSEKQ